MTKKIISVVLVVMLVLLLSPTSINAANSQETSNVGLDERFFNYTINNREVTITGVKDTEIEELIFPETIEGLPVTQILGDFSSCSKVKSILVPNCVTRISNSPFMGLHPTKITIPFVGYRRDKSEGVFVTLGAMFSQNQRYLGNNAPAGLTKQISYRDSNGYYYGYYYDIPKSIKEVVITDATLIPDNAFYNCNWIEKITVNDIVEERSIGKDAFYNCNAKLYVNRGTAIHTFCHNTQHSHCSTQEIQFDNESITLYRNETKPIGAKVILLNGLIDTNPETIFTSSNSSIVKVDRYTGDVTAVSPGTVTITADSEGVKASITVKVLFLLEGIALNKSVTQIDIGESETLSISFSPENTTDSKAITWTSSDDSIASVDNNGKVTAHQKGSVIITATSNNGLESTCLVDVLVPISKIEFQQNEITIARTKKQKLNVLAFPSDSTDTYRYESSDSSVASVDSYGTVTARKVGTATITVTTNRRLTATCIITVNSPATFIQISDKEADLFSGKSIQLTASLAPFDFTDKITWTSSNSEIASVSSNGTVTANKKGIVTITATADSGISDTCTINVENDINATDIDLEYEQTEFDMQLKEPEVTVCYKGNQLIRDTDYRVEYENNYDCGISDVVIYSLKNESYVTKHFSIKQVSISKCKINYKTIMPFVNGKPQRAITGITYQSVPLIENVDYDLEYYNNSDIGTATVEIFGKGNYSSTLKIEFDIRGIIGDINGDGTVNGADSGILTRYISGWMNYENKILNMNVADINGDKRVNGADSGLLARFVAGWKGYDKYITFTAP